MMDSILKWVTESVGGGAEVLAVKPLQGGISTAMHSVELLRNGEAETVVLRQFTNQEWLKQQLDLARHEAEILKWAAQADVPTPELISCKEGDKSAVLMTRLPGEVELQPDNLEDWLRQLAATLVRIHACEVPPETAGYKWEYYSYNDMDAMQVPEWSDQPDIWQQALDIVHGPKPESPQRFIHRDYHPTNVLWQNGHVSGVVDWVNACRGPAGVDVGHCRLNLAKLKGVKAADMFLAEYLRLAGPTFTYEPYWDLVSLMEALPNPPSVYRGWTDLGITDLNEEIVKERYEQLVASVVRRARQSIK